MFSAAFPICPKLEITDPPQVALSPDPEKSIVYQKVWESKTVQSRLRSCPKPWIYDGRKLAWCAFKATEMRFTVDLDAEQGRTNNKKSNIFMITIRPAGTVRLGSLQAYLNGKASFDNSILECMSFLDHVLRQGASERFKLLKRSMFNQESETQRLNQVTEAIKGIYSSIRLTDSINQGGIGLGVNVDVTNQTFWVGQKFEQLVRNFLAVSDGRYRNLDVRSMAQALKPVKGKNGGYTQSEAFKTLRRLQKIRFEVCHRGKSQDSKDYVVKRFVFDQSYGDEGGNARQVTFDKRMPDGTTQKISVHDYFLQQYNARLQYPLLPLIETSKGGMFPMEVCEVKRFNTYPFKLDSAQTQQMIKFAVQRPPARKAEIQKMVANLAWGGDRYLKSFGITINPSLQQISAKLLKNPEVQFANKKLNPSTSGRWDLRGVKFTRPNAVPLTSWGFVSVDNCVDLPTLKNFAKAFISAYKGHGGVIAKDPLYTGFAPGADQQTVIADSFQRFGQTNKATPQIIFYVLKDKTAWIYERLKKNADCRLACLSQMVQADHVRKAAPQYCSNVCMKVNSKLGGQTCKIATASKNPSTFYKVPTMVIGCDVSHGAPGSPQASMAALCASTDADAAVYRAAVQTNGYRVEILTPDNVHSMLGPMVDAWVAKFRSGPTHVFYFRDGVSEGQFAHVIDQELASIREVFKQANKGVVPKITVIVATKRHHIRFFPEKGDKNGNLLPGTVVDKEVTHPFHYDFYLCSHVAIQGTARPVHYNVIHDECGLSPDELQRIIYQQCYQYCRSTTPVSLHPAVYYAHLAGARARAHEDVSSSDKMPTEARDAFNPPGPLAKRDPSLSSTKKTFDICPKLLPLGGAEAREDAKRMFRSTMWWV